MQFVGIDEVAFPRETRLRRPSSRRLGHRDRVTQSLSCDAEIHLPRHTLPRTDQSLPNADPLSKPSETEHQEPARVERRFDGLQARRLPDGALLYVARDRRSRARGLAGLERLAPDHALLLAPCRSIHTLGMRFALDLLWLDAAGRLVRLDAGVPPRRLRTCVRARAVIETGADCGERFAAQLAAVGPI